MNGEERPVKCKGSDNAGEKQKNERSDAGPATIFFLLQEYPPGTLQQQFVAAAGCRNRELVGVLLPGSQGE
jgi:hypothetical protein